ncbi:hypothetical protein F4553_000510 [Allocatelliglobosispora scoriae]|uniref:Lipoprotein n=1 Tax=Allocatelliglobosispora scoriae TaxID=643052 RepID=A0A841BJQ5_9ACTN|nr:hypothetical protein [Allocatelliglobosispora scoriae]MBB5867131.1 hypothetical protein [Allocatelliglobosispora scoriae]
MTTRLHLVSILTWTSLAAVLPACSATTPSAPARSAASSTEGDAAVWTLEPGQSPQRSSTKFRALVTRLGCNGGVTGQVSAPRIRTSESEVVVTFTVAPKQLGAATCPGNDQVPYEVVLGEPLGGRSLVDGECLPGEQAATTSFCYPDAIRFTP